MDRLRLIAEVHKRPVLWDSQRLDRSRQEIANKWKDVANSMGGDVMACKSTWKHLRTCYRVSKNRTMHRIYRDKIDGTYDPINKSYANTWEYYKEMNFLENITRPKRVYELKLLSMRRSKRQGTEANSCPSDNEHTQFIDDDDNVRVAVESDNEIELDPYKMDQAENTVLSINSEDSNLLNDSAKGEEEFISIPLKEKHNLFTIPPIQYITDADNNFLISFSSQMKSMNRVQNLQFRIKMTDLILSFLKTSQLANGSNDPENNMPMKAFFDINDPECNFLVSFLPYMKMMTHLQNLQFRTKISELMLNILLKNDITNNS